MPTVRSFAKINFGLAIGARRDDGFHDLRTIYPTIALHDEVTVTVTPGRGIEVRCEDPRVPLDASNTCYKIIDRALPLLKVGGKVVVEIKKSLPVQGGLGGASANAVAALLGLERAAKKLLSTEQRLEIAAEVGSDLPLFLIGGTVLGVGRGEEVFPLPDLKAIPCVIALPEVGVSTPRAFARWDAQFASCTSPAASVRMNEFSRRITGWLGEGEMYSGVPARGRGRAGNPLPDLVRTGIENDFEQVVFPEYPELRQVKRALERAGAGYASLSGSGSALYGLFARREDASRAASQLNRAGTQAVATTTLPRRQCWRRFLVRG